MSWPVAFVVMVALICATGLAAWIAWLIHLAQPKESTETEE